MLRSRWRRSLSLVLLGLGVFRGPAAFILKGRGAPGGASVRERATARTMTKKDSKKKKSTPDNPNERLVAENRKARHKFEILDTLECGIALVGSEVKSLRHGRLSLDESYGRVKEGEVWLLGADISEYTEASQMNHPTKRPRKLLLHRREISKFARLAHEKGLTLVPLKVYFKQGRAKVLLGLCRGKKLHDKREALKRADSQREIHRTLRNRLR